MLAEALERLARATDVVVRVSRGPHPLRTTLSAGLIVHAVAISSCAPKQADSAYSNHGGVEGDVSSVETTARDPQFGDYPATARFTGERHKVDTSGGEFTPAQVKSLTTALEGGPNFAGEFSLATWGCGTSCQVISVVSLRTGRIYQGVVTNNLPQFRTDSRLLIDVPGTPGDSQCATCARSFYVWRGESFGRLPQSTNSR